MLKADLACSLTERLSVGADMIAVSGSHLRGDESNELDELDGYLVVNARANYRTDRFEAFLLVQNLLDGNYENFGLIGEEPDEVVGLDDIGDDVRFLGPGRAKVDSGRSDVGVLMTGLSPALGSHPWLRTAGAPFW